MERTNRKAVLGLLLAAGVAQAAPRVSLVRAEQRPEERWIAGTVSASRHAQISTRVAATVREVRVREGDRVAQGDVLVRLADGDLRAQEAAARAALEAASANERRIRGLVAAGHVPEAQLDPAEAQRAQAEAQLRSVRESLTYAEIRAPFAGAVLAKLVSPGDLVGPGQPMLELSGNALEIVASASEDETRALKPGMRLRFASDAVQGEAEVSAVSPGGDPVSHRGIVRALVPQASLRPGDFARLRIPAPGEGRVWVPRSALVERGDLTGVFVVHGGRAQLRWISLGEAQGDAAWVRAGIAPGEAIVAQPGALKDGDEVADER